MEPTQNNAEQLPVKKADVTQQMGQSQGNSYAFNNCASVTVNSSANDLDKPVAKIIDYLDKKQSAKDARMVKYVDLVINEVVPKFLDVVKKLAEEKLQQAQKAKTRPEKKAAKRRK